MKHTTRRRYKTTTFLWLYAIRQFSNNINIIYSVEPYRLHFLILVGDSVNTLCYWKNQLVMTLFAVIGGRKGYYPYSTIPLSAISRSIVRSVFRSLKLFFLETTRSTGIRIFGYMARLIFCIVSISRIPALSGMTTYISKFESA